MAKSAPVIKDIFDPLHSGAAWHCIGMGIETWFLILQKTKGNNIWAYQYRYQVWWVLQINELIHLNQTSCAQTYVTSLLQLLNKT